jgi:hypothetical protein
MIASINSVGLKARLKHLAADIHIHKARYLNAAYFDTRH